MVRPLHRASQYTTTILLEIHRTLTPLSQQMRIAVTSFAVALLVVAVLVGRSPAPSFAADQVPAVITREFIYDKASFPQCHASTIAESKQGLVSAWFGGTSEGNDDVGIWVARHLDGKWTEPAEVATGLQDDGDRHPCWNPVLFQPSDSPLLLFYKVGPSPQRWWGMLMRSSDSGATWSTPERLPDGFLGPIKNKPIELPGGELLCPSSSETPTLLSEWRVHFERTPDLGKTWTKVSPADSPDEPPINAIQPSILTRTDERLQAIGRTRSKRLFETWSEDGGKTWSALKLTDLPNPNSGTDAVTLKDGRQLLVYNDTPSGRSPLNLALCDDATAWQMVAALEDERGEFSYPAVIQTSDGLVHITYTWNRKKIRHVTLDPTKLALIK
jgi:predicted neuraminidase